MSIRATAGSSQEGCSGYHSPESPQSFLHQARLRGVCDHQNGRIPTPLSTVGVVTCRQEAEHGEHGRQQQQREQRRCLPKRPTLNPNSKQAELLASVAADMNTFSNDGSFMDRFAALQAAGGADGQTGRPMPAEEEEVSLSGVVVHLACSHTPWHSARESPPVSSLLSNLESCRLL